MSWSRRSTLLLCALCFGATLSLSSSALAGEVKLGPTKLEVDGEGKLTDAGRKAATDELKNEPGDDEVWIAHLWAKLDKGAPFVGADALRAQKSRGVTRKLVGFRLDGRGIARHGYPVWYDGKPVDIVRSGTQSPSLSVSIGTTFLPADVAKVGTRFEVECRGERIPAEVVGRPFWKNGSVKK